MRPRSSERVCFCTRKRRLEVRCGFGRAKQARSDVRQDPGGRRDLCLGFNCGSKHISAMSEARVPHGPESLSRKHDEDRGLWRKATSHLPFSRSCGVTVTSQKTGLTAEVFGIFRGEKIIWRPSQKARLNAFTLLSGSLSRMHLLQGRSTG
jgi:hypothetical protein